MSCFDRPDSSQSASTSVRPVIASGCSIPAVIQAVETTDRCLGTIVDRVDELGGVCLVTADHGNAEELLEPDGVSPQTAHTTNPVPLVVTSVDLRVRDGGELADLSPTTLALLGLEAPSEMKGSSLVSPL